MPQTHDFNQMNLKELRSYVLNHREDEATLRLYMDRLRDDPNVAHYSGGLDDMPYLEQLIRDHTSGGPTR